MTVPSVRPRNARLTLWMGWRAVALPEGLPFHLNRTMRSRRLAGIVVAARNRSQGLAIPVRKGGKMASATTWRPPPAKQPVEDADSQPGPGWTLVLRRQPALVIGGYIDAFELICCDCGDDPDVDYHHVAQGLQQIRGPYSVSAGVAAYAEHVRHHQQQAARHAARRGPASKRPE